MSTAYAQTLSTNNASSAGQARPLGGGSLPVIDIAPLFKRNVADKRRVADAIGEAAREVGFFYIANHPVAQPLIDAVYGEAERFFDLPLTEKLRYYIGHSRNHRGYVPRSEKGNYADERERLYEAFDLALELAADDPDYENGSLLLGPNVWPLLAGFRETVYAYYRAVATLAETMCRAFELHLRLAPGYFRQFMQKPTSQLRLIHYLENDAPRSQGDMQMGAHTDYECFTLLHQSKPGLEVLTTENTWLAAPPIQGTYVVNIGDMMEVWTNGAFKATPHRVVNTGKERFSLPYFAAADFNAEIKPVPTMIGSHEPSRYPKIIAGHHLLRQLLRDFAYLNRSRREGRLRLPFDVAGHQGHNPFEQRLSASLGAH